MKKLEIVKADVVKGFGQWLEIEFADHPKLLCLKSTSNLCRQFCRGISNLSELVGRKILLADLPARSTKDAKWELK